MSFAANVVSGFRTLQAATGVVVTVSRGAATTPNVVAVPGVSEHTYSQSDQVTTETQSRDFLFLLSYYRNNSAPTLPVGADTILADGITYDILSNAGEAYFRFCDNNKQIIRVHCKP
jgi:hypothetical protein